MIDFSKIHPNEGLLTGAYILSKITQEQIFTYYYPEFEIGKRLSSPFRKDKNPSFSFYSGKNYIKATDFSTGDHWNCFEFVKDLLKLTDYKETLKQIAIDFNILQYASHDLTNITPIKVLNNTKPSTKKIIVSTCPFTQNIIEYWNQYSITLEELINNLGYNFNQYVISKPNKSSTITSINSTRTAFLVEYNKKSYWKIYQPYSSKHKWISNVPLFVPFGILTLPHASDTLIITKSWKDMVILRKFHTDVIAVQNESISSLIEIHDLPYKRKIIMFDHDETGLTVLDEIKETFGYEIYTTGDHKHKDISDLVKHNGLLSAEQLIKNII